MDVAPMDAVSVGGHHDGVIKSAAPVPGENESAVAPMDAAPTASTDGMVEATLDGFDHWAGEGAPAARTMDTAWHTLVSQGRGGPPMVSNHGACVVDGRVIVFGGDGRSSRVAHTLCYNPVKAKWSKLKVFGSVPRARSHHGVVAANGTQVFVFGGSNIRGSLDDLYVFDMETKVWNQIEAFGSRPTPRWGHGMATGGDGKKIFVVGGYYEAKGDEDGGADLNDVYELDLETNRWRRIATRGATLPGREGHSMVWYAGKLWVFGGRNINCLGDMFCFDIETSEWKEIRCRGDVPSPRRGHGMVVDPYGDRFFLFGGETPEGLDGQLYAFDVASETWTLLESGGLNNGAAGSTSTSAEVAGSNDGGESGEAGAHGGSPGARSGHSMVVVDGVAVVFGGEVDSGRQTNETLGLDLTVLDVPTAPPPAVEIAYHDQHGRRYAYAPGDNGAKLIMLFPQRSIGGGGVPRSPPSVGDELLLVHHLTGNMVSAVVGTVPEVGPNHDHAVVELVDIIAFDRTDGAAA